MSKIDDQIKELMLKKRKVELYQLLLDFVTPQERKAEDGPGEDTFADIRESVKAFVDAQIQLIEEAKLESSPQAVNDQVQFSQDEVKVLKEMVQKLLSKAPSKPVNPGVFNDPSEPTDPLSFAQKHRNFDGKKVKANTPNGPVTGRVVGLDTPNIVVKTDTGYTVGFAPKDLEIIS